MGSAPTVRRWQVIVLPVLVGVLLAGCSGPADGHEKNVDRAADAAKEYADSYREHVGFFLAGHDTATAGLAALRDELKAGYPQNKVRVIATQVDGGEATVRLAVFGESYGGPTGSQDTDYVEICVEMSGVAGVPSVSSRQVACPATPPEGSPPPDMVKRVLQP